MQPCTAASSRSRGGGAANNWEPGFPSGWRAGRGRSNVSPPLMRFILSPHQQLQYIPPAAGTTALRMSPRLIVLSPITAPLCGVGWCGAAMACAASELAICERSSYSPFV